MNIKDRLEKQKKTSNSVRVKSDSDIDEIFVKNENAEKVLHNELYKKRNFLLVSADDCDKSILNLYIKNLLKYKKNVISNNGIKGLVELFESTLAGREGCIANINIKTFDEIIDNLKILVSISFPNLSQNHINKILTVSNPIIVYFNKDDDGLFFIGNIGEIVIKNNELSLNNLYAAGTNIQEEVKNDEIICTSKDEPENVLIENEKPKKINKYKLLREKIHNKKMI